MMWRPSPIAVSSMALSGALTAMLLTAPAWGAETFTLSELSVDDGRVFVRAAKIEFVGASIGRGEIETLVKDRRAGDLLEKLAGGSAERIAAPELTVEVRPPTVSPETPRSSYTLKGLAIGRLERGIAQTIDIDGLETRGTDREAATGKIRASGVGLGTIVATTLGRPVVENQRPILAEARVDGGRLTHRGTLTTIATIVAKDLERRSEQAGRHALPYVGRLSLTGIEGRRAGATAATPVAPAWTVAEVSLAAEQPDRTSIPSRFSLQVREVAIDTATLARKDLAELGYRRFRVSAKLEGAYDAATRALTIASLGASAEDFAALELSFDLGNVEPDAFQKIGEGGAVPPTATVRRMALRLQDTGLHERLVARSARKSGKSPDLARTEMAIQARLVATAMLGAEAASPFGEALMRFLAAPGTFTLTSLAKAPEGVPIADLSKRDEKGPLILGRFTTEAVAK